MKTDMGGAPGSGGPEKLTACVRTTQAPPADQGAPQEGEKRRKAHEKVLGNLVASWLLQLKVYLIPMPIKKKENGQNPKEYATGDYPFQKYFP